MLRLVQQRRGHYASFSQIVYTSTFSQDVPSQDNLEPSTQRKAIDSRNDRLLTTPPTEPAEPTKWMSLKPWTCVDLSTSNLSQLNQILSCTEALLAGTCNDGDAQVGLAVEPIKDLPHFEVTGEGNAIHLLLAIYGHEEDIVGWVREEDMLGWRRTGLRFDGRHGGQTRSWCSELQY